MYKLSLVGGDALPAQEMLVLWAHNSCMPGSVLEEQPQGSAAGELQGAGYKQNKSLWLSPTPGTWYFVFSDLHFSWLKKKYRSPGLTSICTSYLLQNDIQAWNPTWLNAWRRLLAAPCSAFCASPFQHVAATRPRLRNGYLGTKWALYAGRYPTQ